MKLTKDEILQRKNKIKIAMLTSYDYPTACLLDRCSIDIQLVGDSVGTNVLGYPDVSSVTMADMLHHLKAVARGAKHSFILCDMPFESCRTREDALANAHILCHAGADGVKIESEKCAIDKIAYVASAGIAVCAHIGYTPQTPGLSPSIQGKNLPRAIELIQLAWKCQRAGAFMIVLELIPEDLAKLITQSLEIPTIGIGAGRFCDGQVQVILDILGISQMPLRHVKTYSDASRTFSDAVKSYISEVRDTSFPTEKQIVSMPQNIIDQVKEWMLSNKE